MLFTNAQRMKTLSDRDLGIECDFVAEGETEDDVLNASTNHLKDMHPEEQKKMSNTTMREAIRDEESETMDDDEGG